VRQILRKTLLFALLLALSLVGVVLLALTLPGDEDAEVHTHAVGEMVASADGGFQHVGLDTAPHSATAAQRWPGAALSLALVPFAAWIARRCVVDLQQQSRSKRS
jgi:hypothetical protein